MAQSKAAMCVLALMFPIALLLSGCDQIAELPIVGNIFASRLQCHDDRVIRTAIDIVEEQTKEEIGDDAHALISLHDLVNAGPARLSLIVENKRDSSGGIDCSSQLSVDTSKASITPQQYANLVKNELAVSQIYSRYMQVQQDGEKELRLALMSAPDKTAGSLVTWNFGYAVQPTSDKKDVVVTVTGSKPIARYLAMYVTMSARSNPAVANGRFAPTHCGVTKIETTGLSPNDAGVMQLGASTNSIIITGNSKRIAFTDDDNFSKAERDQPLEDFNKMQCVMTQAGTRLVIGEQCGGSSCSDAFSYYVVDADQVLLITKTGIDEKALDELLGQHLSFND